MEQYNNFNAEDFVWDPFFRQWVLAPTKETDAFWIKWIAENPGMPEKTAMAREIILSIRVTEMELTEDEIRHSVKQAASKLEKPAANPKAEIRRLYVPFFKTAWFRVAASIVLLSCIGMLAKIYFTPFHDSVHTGKMVAAEQTEFIKKVNTTQTAMRIELDDKSRIFLSPNSIVRYKRRFQGEKREVFLEGEAFFEVSKNPESPFFVYARDLVTKVLGTSFRITTFNTSRKVMVEVKTGRVSVFARSDPDHAGKSESNALKGTVLSANQKIIYDQDHARMVKTLVEKPEIIIPKAQVPEFVFEDVAVSEVFDSIARAYGIDILYDAEVLRGCPLTAILDKQTLHDKLTIICKAIEASYEIVDGQIIIHSDGCKN
jgi:transmembrane sensor